CEQRDTKGHYAKARSGEYRDFPGVDVPYDVPENPEIVIPVDVISMDEAEKRVIAYLRKTFLNH
ncbi:MAG: adenylyl-sulfate kinase, partial [Desulfuromonadales bacterium]